MYEEPVLLHYQHVTNKKIECLNCHIEILHSQVAAMEQLPGDCSSCHSQQHQAVKAFYMGVGGRGVKETPAPMYLAHVDCKGCHTLTDETPVGDVITKASLESCIKCHGDKVRPVYTGWKLLVENRRDEVSREYNKVRQILSSKWGKKMAENRLEDARHNLALMNGVVGIHNISFTEELSRAIHNELNKALEEGEFKKRKQPWREIPYESECLHCHVGIEFISAKAFGRFQYSHYDHVIGAGLVCERCHEGTHDMGKMKIGSRDCATCHHDKSQPSCAHCHKNLKKLKVTVEGKPFSHTFHVKELEMECSTCHSPEGKRMGIMKDACAECHES
jgi:hypothetical protein